MSRLLKTLAAALALIGASYAASECVPNAFAQSVVRTESIAGTRWRGAFDSLNDYTTTYRFNADGTAEWSDNGQTSWTGRENHTWTQDGGAVTWRHSDGTVWRANIRPPGNIMTGVIYGPDSEPRGVFRLTRQ